MRGGGCYVFHNIMVLFSIGGLTNGHSELYGTLDLGGGSTQITLRPTDQVNNSIELCIYS